MSAIIKAAKALRDKIEWEDEDIDRAEEKYEQKLQFLEKVQNEFLQVIDIDVEKEHRKRKI